ncbi:MAG: type I methionyl aminopeptidase [Armatimonadetes bacterium]|nr:type I methionyl aminopeptidase [Armatimonadota bacterium]
MRIRLKSERELALMRQASALVVDTLRLLRDRVRPGVTTAELDRLAEAYIRSRGGVPSFKGYRGFPASACISVNDQVVHGIPGPRRLEEGDIVKVDIGALVGGYHGDAAITLPVGAVSPAATALMAHTYGSLLAGIAAARAGNRLGDISCAVQRHAERQGYSVVRELVGHGIGRDMHEDPPVPNCGHPGRGPLLVPGMTLAIEPMINEGGPAVNEPSDEWTYTTADGRLSAHFEHTVAIGRNGPEVLTRWPYGEEPVCAGLPAAPALRAG